MNFLTTLSALVIFLSLVCPIWSQSSVVGYDCDEEKQRGVYYECFRCRLREIPQTIPTNTECIVLSDNYIRHLKPSDFQNLPRLRKLWIHDNRAFNMRSIYTNKHLERLTALHLTEGTLSESPIHLQLPELEVLDIRGNRLTDVLRMEYHNLPKLHNLDLSINRIWRISSDSLKPLPRNLTRLAMSTTVLYNADDVFTHLSKLEFLSLTNNNLGSIPTGLPRSLKEFHMHGNRIRNITASTFAPLDHLTSLRHLRLQGEKLMSDSVRHLRNVRHLNLKTCDVYPFAFRGVNKITTLEMPSPCRRWGRNPGLVLFPSAFEGFSSLVDLSITRSYMTSVPRRAFAGLKRMKSINLANNRINTIAPDAFYQVDGLQFINFNYNRLMKSPGHLPHTLKEIQMLGNNIDSLTEHIFPRLPSLRKLSVEAGRIHQDAFSTVNNVEELTVRTCEIHSHAFRGLSKVTEFIMNRHCRSQRQQNLRLSSYSFTGLDRVTKIELKSNRITEIPSYAFSGLSELKYLNLNLNYYIKDFPETALDGCVSLEKLILSGNRLEAVPKGLPQSLIELYLDNNQIKSVNEHSFSLLPNLRKLVLKTDSVEPDSFKNTPNLVDIKLQTCSLGSYAFRGLDILKVLPLNRTCPFNHLTMTIEEHAFSGMESVEIIDLSGNMLYYIPAKVFDGLENLRIINLASNRITSLHSDAFVGLTNLKYLSLFSNRITEVPSNLPQTLTHLNLGLTSIAELNSTSLPPLNNLVELEVRASVIKEDAFMNCATISRLAVKTCKLEGNAFKGLNRIVSLNMDHACSGIQSLVIDSHGYAGLTNIQSISLASSRIRSLPAMAFPNLINLRSVFLDRNWIDQIDPDAFEGSNHIEALTLDNNRLRNIPINLPSSLKTLTLISNYIQNISSSSFSKNLPNLLTLNISTGTVDTDSFVNTPNLTSLNLRTGNIKSYAFRSLKKLPEFRMEFVTYRGGLNVSSFAFAGMDSLETLSLKFCNIRQLPTKAFADIPNLRSLNLSMNYISVLPPGLLDGCRNLKEFSIFRTYDTRSVISLGEGVFNTAGKYFVNKGVLNS